MEISNAKANFGLRATTGYQGALVAGEVVIGASNTGIPLTGADVAYSLRAQVNAAATFNVDIMAGSPPGVLTGVTITGVTPSESNGYYDISSWDGSSNLYGITNGLGGLLEYAAFNGRWTVTKAGTGNGMQSTFATAFSPSPGVAAWEDCSGGTAGTAVDHFSASGTDHEGLPIPSLVTVQGFLIEVTTGTGTVSGTTSDSLTYASGDIIPLYNATGITSDLADMLTIAATTHTDMTITVIGRTT